MKALVVLAIRGNTLSRAQAGNYYALSEEELSMWEDCFAVDGIAGLQIKRGAGLKKQSGPSATNSN
jgi:hypothetical protein